ncbi:hypothetical protein LQ50_21415 [Halalkalibacter okhensis]|uniref:Uncharacterized protein n=1 Tax=Halalkalibacter okhensis TaxID=333138 RepID=A0A0B0IEG3_9BACI|nr:hypothetical protein LQ50_21415 [Halalkalibacter okhensis]
MGGRNYIEWGLSKRARTFWKLFLEEVRWLRARAPKGEGRSFGLKRRRRLRPSQEKPPKEKPPKGKAPFGGFSKT